MNRLWWLAAVALGLPFYSYVAYPVMLFLLAAMVQTVRDALYVVRRRERRRRTSAPPRVSVIVAAYNEEAVIGRTLRACLEADYPRDRLEILVGVDGATDRTAELARRAGGDAVHVLEFDRRRGKAAVLADCAAEASGDILVLTDANTRLAPDALIRLTRHFDDERVGAVCGELRLAGPDGAPGDEGLYWRYEVVLKMLESRLNAVLGANGALYAVRRDLFPALRPDVITDDFVVPMKVRARGRRVVYDPEAVAFEETPGRMRDEFRRRLRIGAGNWQALRLCAALLLPWKGPVAIAFWSHKVLRWCTPFLLPVALAANALLLHEPFWRVVFALQCAFYGAAAIGFALSRLGVRGGPFRLAAYFVAINAALGLGMVRGVLHVQRAAWDRTARGTATAGLRQ